MEKSLGLRDGPLRSSTIGKILFHLEDVTVSFERIDALKSIQFSVESSEVVFITGVSGAGKTTLLRVLSGEILPNQGKVERARTSVYGTPIFVTEVFQDLRLAGNQTCRENLLFSYDPSLFKGRDEFEKEMKDLCNIFCITDRLDVKVNDANGGLKQIVAIVRALLARPDVLLADEPTSALDFENTKKVFEVLNMYNLKRSMTVIWASHNRELVKNFSGRIVHLEGGRLIYSGHACFI